MIGAVIVPSMAFASNNDAPQPHEVEMSQESGEPMAEPHKKNKRPPHLMDKKMEKKLKSLTEAEKELFFNDRITQMEKHVERVQKDINELKSLSTAEKEEWFKAKKKEGKKGKHKGKHKGDKEDRKMKHERMIQKCSEMDDVKPPKTAEEVIAKLESSKRYQSASDEKKAEMMKRVEKFNSMSEEERAAHFEKGRMKLEKHCAKIEKRAEKKAERNSEEK